MMLTLLSLTLITLSPCVSAQDHSERSMAAETSTNLAEVGGHGRIEKKSSHVGDAARMKLSGAGITMMEGVAVGGSASLIRREAKPASRSEKMASGGASIVELSTSDHKDLGKQRAVTWAPCEGGSCKCSTVGTQTSVIRYTRQYEPGSPIVNPQMTNWHYRTHTRPYINTSVAEFSKGYKINTTNLPLCGGEAAFSKDCVVQPTACEFDKTDFNPYDAKTGEYCCSGKYGYCSYKCIGDEVFNCPTLTFDQNFPGGMDPSGPDVPKTCMLAVYLQGKNPESSSDADVDTAAAPAAAATAATAAPA